MVSPSKKRGETEREDPVMCLVREEFCRLPAASDLPESTRATLMGIRRVKAFHQARILPRDSEDPLRLELEPLLSAFILVWEGHVNNLEEDERLQMENASKQAMTERAEEQALAVEVATLREQVRRLSSEARVREAESAAVDDIETGDERIGRSRRLSDIPNEGDWPTETEGHLNEELMESRAPKRAAQVGRGTNLLSVASQL